MIRRLQISAGRGPQECCWVVFQLVHYLVQAAGEMGLQAELLEVVAGDSPNTYRSALLALEGDNRVGDFVKHWQGTVQWIGQSPFRPNHKRKNWFVSVTALLAMEPEKMNLDEIKFEHMRASGPGGQHVNKTESAVRVVHLPTGLSAISQTERSQYFNKKLALARLAELLRQKAQAAQAGLEQKRWQQHNRLERGNAAHLFKGNNFTHVQ